MIIDDGNFHWTKRYNLFNKEIKELGYAHGIHNEFLYCWVFIYADEICIKKLDSYYHLIPGAISVTKKIVPERLENGELVMKKFLLYTMKDGSSVY